MSGAGEALRATGIVKAFGSLKALDGVTLHIEKGEYVVLLGPNGAGKTTLFQILTGLFVPDAGEVSIGGIDLRRRPAEALARLGIVFQQPTLDLELGVERNLVFFARLQGMPRSLARRRIAEELASFGLAERRHDPASALSGGNRRRVELARALLHEPSFLLMDEATVGLDPQSRREILDRIVGLRDARRVGILWATHLVDEAADADRVVVLDKGRVLFDGTVPALIARGGGGTLERSFLALIGRLAPAPATVAS